MPTPFPPELLDTFRAMAEIVYSGESYDSVYEAVCHSAVAGRRLRPRLADAPAWRHGSRPWPRRTTSRVHIDELEKELGEGPCLDAMDDDEPDQHFCPDLTEGSKWPELAKRIMEETSVRGMAGFRLRQERPEGRRAQRLQRHPGCAHRALAGAGDHADRLRVGHVGRPRAGRGSDHPAPRAGEQPRDRQGHRPADGDAQHRRRPGLRDAGQGLAGDERQGRRGRRPGRRPPPQGTRRKASGRPTSSGLAGEPALPVRGWSRAIV